MPPHHTMNKVEITAGQYISATAGITLSTKAKSIAISRGDYLSKIQWLSSQYVNIWDEDDKTGWLVNGATALLHLLRASFHHSKAQFGSLFELDPDDLRDISDSSNANAAKNILLNEEYRELQLYWESSEITSEEIQDGVSKGSIVTMRRRRYKVLQDRIEHLFNVMEKLFEHEEHVGQQDGIHLRRRSRGQLEGWDFKALAADEGPIVPLVTSITTSGKVWVDFTRAIHTVALFGKGFGNLIRPKQPAYPECRWSKVPTKQCYLAVCVSELEAIMKAKGNSSTNPRTLCDKILWYMKSSSFSLCPCTQGAIMKHCDPVQSLFPSNFMSRFRKCPQVGLPSNGAVIFGRNENLHWDWRDHGDPVKGDPPPEDRELSQLASQSSSTETSSSEVSPRADSSNSPTNDTPPSSVLEEEDPESLGLGTMQTKGKEIAGPAGSSLRSLKRRCRQATEPIKKRTRFSSSSGS